MNNQNTLLQFDKALQKCEAIFLLKTKDYGTAWRILRIKSITDQIFIKAQRIRTIEENKEQKVNEGSEAEFIGIVNYAIIGLIQLQLGADERMEIPNLEVKKLFRDKAIMAKELMQNKNHDYGEAWRSMRVSSMTDLILMKIYRIRQIEDNNGKTVISEGIDASYLDIINYAIFALIKSFPND
jgi:hypothetical protein